VSREGEMSSIATQCFTGLRPLINKPQSYDNNYIRQVNGVKLARYYAIITVRLWAPRSYEKRGGLGPLRVYDPNGHWTRDLPVDQPTPYRWHHHGTFNRVAFI